MVLYLSTNCPRQIFFIVTLFKKATIQKGGEERHKDRILGEERVERSETLSLYIA
jgi:hypothetical protein